MNFHSPDTRRVYSERSVSEDWRAWCKQYLAPENKDVVDIGCGGRDAAIKQLSSTKGNVKCSKRLLVRGCTSYG